MPMVATSDTWGGALQGFGVKGEACCPGAQVYTFGAPRPGDTNFARECNQLFPDMWHIINDAARPPPCSLFFHHQPQCLLHGLSLCSSPVYALTTA